MNEKEQVIRAGRQLAESGLIVRTWGNISVRRGARQFAITASGRNYMRLTEEEVVDVTWQENSDTALQWSGRFHPSSESKMHAALYRNIPQARFIIHTHQTQASILGCCRDAEPLLRQRDAFIPVAEYGRSGSPELARRVAEAAGRIPSGQRSAGAVIMKHHGAVAWGSDADEAFRIAVKLEQHCAAIISEGQMPQGNAAADACCREHVLLYPYLDDFAMMIGPEATVEEALTEADLMTAEDRDALRLLLKKNASAFYAAPVFGGGSPISHEDAQWLREKYVKQYAKLEESQ